MVIFGPIPLAYLERTKVLHLQIFCEKIKAVVCVPLKLLREFSVNNRQLASS
jgi:hypothetical protein